MSDNPDDTIETSKKPTGTPADDKPDFEAQLADTAAMVLEDVPAHLKAIIPTGLSPADQIKWFKEAKATGVFAKPKVPATDDNKPTVTPVEKNPADLPVFARMAASYGNRA